MIVNNTGGKFETLKGKSSCVSFFQNFALMHAHADLFVWNLQIEIVNYYHRCCISNYHCVLYRYNTLIILMRPVTIARLTVVAEIL